MYRHSIATPREGEDSDDDILDDARNSHAPSTLGALIGKQRSSVRKLPPEAPAVPNRIDEC